MTHARRFLWTALPLSLLLIGSIPAVADPITLTLTDYIDFAGSGLPTGTALTFQVTLPEPLTAYPDPPFSDYFDFTSANLISALPANVQFSGDLKLHADSDIDHIDHIEFDDAVVIGATQYDGSGFVSFNTPCVPTQTPSTCTASSVEEFSNDSTGSIAQASKPDTLTVTSATSAVPEPSTLSAVGVGAALLLLLRRRRVTASNPRSS